MKNMLRFLPLFFIFSLAAQPSWQGEICLVSVDSASSSYISIIWNKPVANDIDSFYIYRADSNSTVFSKIASVDYADSSAYDDIAVNVNTTWYSYLVSAIDFNGVEGLKSDTANTCLLNVIPNLASGYFTCKWNKYNNGNNQPSIVRCMWDSLGNAGSLQQIGVNWGPSLTSWNHYGYSQANTSVYRLEVEMTNPCNPSRGLINTSRSNVKGVANPLTLGIASTELTKLARTFPNPANDVLQMEWNGMLGVSKIDIIDLSGKVVHSIAVAANELKLNFKISDFEKGIYLIRFHSEVGPIVQRVVKQ
jgi:Secretion system C-terminal sorting domain